MLADVAACADVVHARRVATRWFDRMNRIVRSSRPRGEPSAPTAQLCERDNLHRAKLVMPLVMSTGSQAHARTVGRCCPARLDPNHPKSRLSRRFRIVRRITDYNRLVGEQLESLQGSFE